MNDERRIFYGINIKPLRKYAQPVVDSLHISNAALHSGVYVRFYLKIRNTTFTIASLSHAKPQVALDLNFNGGDHVYFYAVGHGQVSVLGYSLQAQPPAMYVPSLHMVPHGVHENTCFYEVDGDGAENVDSYGTVPGSYILVSSATDHLQYYTDRYVYSAQVENTTGQFVIFDISQPNRGKWGYVDNGKRVGTVLHGCGNNEECSWWS